jgi:O-antigen/teichoic acid export membrane protein
MNSDNKRIVKNSIFLYLLTFSNYFLGLLVYPYLSRVLSVESFGLIGFSMSFVLIFQVIVEFGFTISTTALIAKNRADYGKVSEIISTTMIVKCALAIMSFLLLVIVIFSVTMIGDNFMIILLFFANAIFSAMLPDFFYRGIEQMKIITIRTVLIKMVSLLMILVFVKDEKQILLVPIAMITGSLIALIITIFHMKKIGIIFVRVKTKDAIICIKDGFGFFLSRLAVSINSSLGIFFLGLNYLPASFELGIFSGVSKIASSGEMMLHPVTDSIYPHMINKRDYRLLKKVLAVGTISVFVICIVISIFADNICAIILGKEYSVAGNYLRILMIGLFFAFPCMILGYPALSPVGLEKHANIAVMASAGVGVVICTVLWRVNAVSILSVCIVMASRNIVMVVYRGIALYKYARLIKKSEKL